MPKQQLYAWASLGSSVALAGLYLLFFVGIPFITGPIMEGATEAFLWIAGIAFLIELLLDLGSGRDRVEADERDRLIAGRAFRVGYYVFVVAIAFLIGHLFITDLLTSAGGPDPYVDRMPGFTRHFAVLAFLVATASKAGTQVWIYARGA